MTPRSTPLIVNPAAGGGRCGRRIAEAEARLRTAHFPVDLHLTTGPGDARALAARLADEGHPTLLVAGGDGTTFEVVDGLFTDRPSHAPRPTLGMIPLGTGNSFLRDVEIFDADQAIAAVLAGHTRPVDVVRLACAEGPLHYLNLLSLGFTARAGDLTNRWFKPLGDAGYVVATLVETARLYAEPLPHRLDGGDLDDRPYTFLSLSNSRCTGGAMQMAPDAQIDDGAIDVIRIGRLRRDELLRLFPRIFSGRHLEHPANDAVRAREVRFDLPGPVPCMIDGEVLIRQPQRLTLLPRALDILA